MTTTPAPARPKPPTAAGMLRLAEAVPEAAENFPILRELRKALETLVKIAPESEGAGRIIGYVVVDKVTNKLDWDGDLHPLRVDALESLTGPRQMWCKNLEDETEDRTFWAKAYDICPVYASEVTA